MPVDLNRLEIIIGAQMENAVLQLLGDLETRLATMIAGGMSEDAALVVLAEDLKTGGVTFGTYRNRVKRLAVNAVRGATNEAIFNAYDDAGLNNMRWVTVSGNPCPQCSDRQGEINTFDFWENVGLPKSGFSVCGDNCRCILIPVGFESAALKTQGFLVPL